MGNNSFSRQLHVFLKMINGIVCLVGICEGWNIQPCPHPPATHTPTMQHCMNPTSSWLCSAGTDPPAHLE